MSDYTFIIARGLAAAGDTVHVWCPPVDGETPAMPGVIVHRELGRIAPSDLRRLEHQLNQFAGPRCLLVQWVPHGYGYRSLNLPFCLWLWKRARAGRERVEIVLHEPYLSFSGSWKQHAAALTHRLMTVVLGRAASRVWMTIPAWERYWRPYLAGRDLPFVWLPVPSTIAVVDDQPGVAKVRERYAPAGCMLIGHFGTYGRHLTALLKDGLPSLLQGRADRVALLMGRGGPTLRDYLIQAYPELAGRIYAPGPLAAADLSRHLSACDLLLQPYPDGVSSRRTSVMAGLAHGRPIVTMAGPLTEPLWAASRSVTLAPAGDLAALVSLTEQVLIDAGERSRLGEAARQLYQSHFDVKYTVAALRETENNR